MNTLCITGPLAQDLDTVTLLLQQAGMHTARPARADAERTMAWWHAQLAARAAGSEEHTASPLLIPPLIKHDVPGRFWENQASDIFLGNLDARLWGWSDPQSLALMDFWLGFDPKLNFILVCTPSERLVARMLAGDGESPDLVATLARWQDWHQAMLRIHLRHPDRCLLVDAAACESDPQGFIRLVVERWPGSALTVPEYPDFPATHTDALARHLAREMLAPFSEVVGLQNELDATLPAIAGDDTGDTALTSLEQLLQDYRGLKAQIAKLGVEKTELAAAHDELNKVNAELAQEKEAEVGRAARRASELQEESDLLLQQLHQVQEEFEALYLKQEGLDKECDQLRQAKSKLDAQVASLQQEQAKLIKARDEQSRFAADAKTLNAQLTKTRDELTRARDDLARQLAEAKAQSAQLTKERDALARERTEQVKLLAEHRAQLAKTTELTRVKDEQTRLAAERLAQIGQLAKAQTVLQQELAMLRARPPQDPAQAEALESAQKRLKELQSRNELLLLQLHQVQDELNNYFNQFQELRQQHAEAEERYQRLLEGNPGHRDVAAVEWVSGKDGVHTWLLRNVVGAGRSLKQVQLQTPLVNGFAGLTFSRDSAGRSPLSRWPGADNQQQFTLLPAADSAGVEAFAQTALGLSTSDWALLPVLVNLLDATLEQGSAQKLPKGFDVNALRGGLHAFAAMLKGFPDLLRYDTLTLKREQVNPDYEHLWLQFTNLSLGKERWHTFEFRLSCAHLGPQPFGRFPKLEFPADAGQAPFDSWFEESHDDFGSKLELRFTLEHDLFDVAVWKRLSEHDQRIITEILKLLPIWISTLERGDTKLRRPWQEWRQMVNEMQRIMRQGLQSAVAPAMTEKVPAAPRKRKEVQTKGHSGKPLKLKKAR